MDIRIVYTRPDGGLNVVIPTGAIPIEDVLKKDIPVDATDVRVITADTIPADRTYRNAWKQDVESIVVPIIHDIEKAKEIHKDRLREMRTPLLAALDIQYMIADEREDIETKRAIAAKKQALRDVTDSLTIVEATTIEELKEAVPSVLSEVSAEVAISTARLIK